MIQLTEEFCEYLGYWIGDGYFGNYGKRKKVFQIGVTGHKILDRSYFEGFLKPVLNKYLPQANPLLQFRKNENTIDLIVYSKAFFEFLQKLGFKPGVKTYTVRIPPSLLTTKSNIIAVIRGIFNADGSVFFDKRFTFNGPYPRIDLHMKNPSLIRQIFSYLILYDISATVLNDYSKIQINGRRNVAKFQEVIGFSNERHLKKIRGI